MIYVIIVWLTIGIGIEVRKFNTLAKFRDDFNIFSAPKTVGKFFLVAIAWPVFLEDGK